VGGLQVSHELHDVSVLESDAPGGLLHDQAGRHRRRLGSLVQTERADPQHSGTMTHTVPFYRETHTTTTTLRPFNGLFSGTAWVSRHQKGGTVPDFHEPRDDGVAVASAGPYANHLHVAPDR